MSSWVPSHVELTIHQARDLLLKTKNSNSVVYVSVVAEREKYHSPFLSPSSAPLWQHSTKIPLMSLGTTLLCTVRQKTSIKDKFLGLVSIPLSSFTITSKPVTHWYKLGTKLGKTNTKLRGELLLSLRFLSDWVIEEQPKQSSVEKPIKSSLSFRRRSMLKKTKSEVTKSRGSDTSNDSLAGGTCEGEGVAGKTKKEKAGGGSGRFRLSIRKKTKSPVLESCDDEFMSLSPPGKGDPPHSLPSSSSTEGDIFDSTAEYLSRSLDPKYLPNGQSHSGGRMPESESGSGVEEGGGEGEKEEETGSPVKGDKETQTEKMSPALRYHNFRRKKRPWSMHTLPLNPHFQTEDTSPPGSESKPLPGVDQGQDGSQKEVVTYRAKSSLARGDRSARHARVQRANSVIVDNREDSSESLSTTPTHSPLLGSTRALGNSDRSRSSGLGNVANSSTLPASIRRSRAQSMSGASTTTGSRSGRTKPATSGDKKESSGSQQQSLSHIKSMGLGPRVPLAKSLSDSPRRGSAGASRIAAGLASPKTSPAHGLARNPSPIQLESTLMEEDEDGEEGGSGSSRGGGSLARQSVGQTVKSRVPIETESAAFQVDVSELEIVLEARPRRQSIVVASAPATKPQQSVSLPCSPSRSPARQKTAPELTGHAQSTSPVATGVRDERGTPCLSERSSSATGLVGGRGGGGEREGGAGEEIDGFSTVPRRSSAKHSVSFKEQSKHEYEPIPALPPCLTHSQTPPRKANVRRSHSEKGRPLSSLDSPITKQSDPIIPQEVKGLHNIRTFDPRLFNLPTPPQPRVSVTKSSLDETDAPVVATSSSSNPSPPLSSSSPHTRSVTPEKPSSPTKSRSPIPPRKLAQSYPGSPPSGVAGGGGGGGGGRRGGGGLQGAMSRYQENRRRSKRASPRRSLDNMAKMGIPPPPENVSISAGNSPTMRRASTHLGHSHRSPESGWRNPFSNLRRTQSHKAAATTLEGRLQGSTHSVSSDSLSSASGSPHHVSSEITSPQNDHTTSLGDPSIDVTSPHHQGLGAAAARNSNSNNEQHGSRTVATPTQQLTTSDTDSVRTFGSERTLVEACGGIVADTTTTTTTTTVTGGSSGGGGGSLGMLLSLPRPQHKQTCNSVDSEGLGSLASEEVEETGPQDWVQLSKEELVRELIHTKARLHSTEEELKAVRGYLDNLLLRIMETNPGILSVENP